MRTTMIPVRYASELPPHMTTALTELYSQRDAILPRADDPAGIAAETRRQMLVSARLDAWWTLLGRWVLTDSDLPLLLGRAAVLAGETELAEAERWRARFQRWSIGTPLTRRVDR